MNAARAAVGLVLASLDEAAPLETVKQPYQRRSLDGKCGGELLLAHAVAEPADIDERPPRRLGEPDQAQLGIHRLTQPPRDAGDEKAEVRVLGR